MVQTATQHVESVGHRGHPHTRQGAGQQASQAPGAGPRDQQLRGVGVGIASGHQQHLSWRHYHGMVTLSYAHYQLSTHQVSTSGHVAATPVVRSAHIERWQVLQPARPPVPGLSTVQYGTVHYAVQSTVQYSTVQYSGPGLPPAGLLGIMRVLASQGPNT